MLLMRRCACRLPPAAAAAAAIVACGWGPRLPACVPPPPPLPSAPRRRLAAAAAAGSAGGGVSEPPPRRRAERHAAAAAAVESGAGGAGEPPPRRRIEGLPVVYHPLYSAPTLIGPGGTPHRFPMGVFRRIYERCLSQGIVPPGQVHVPPAPWPGQEQLLRVRRAPLLPSCSRRIARACPPRRGRR